MFYNYYSSHDYFSNGFNTFADAHADAKRTGFETAIYKSDAMNVYRDENKTLVATYGVLSGTTYYKKEYRTA